MKQLQNKTAVITGGNSSIGLATVKVFKDRGATVPFTGRNAGLLPQRQNRPGRSVSFLTSRA